MEFALLALFLFTLIFAVVEFSLIFNAKLTIVEAARYACRKGVAGRSCAEMRDSVRARTRLNIADDDILIQHNLQPDGGGSSWVTTADSPANSDYRTLAVTNTAPKDSCLRVRVRWTHSMITGRLLGGIIGTNIKVDSQIAMQRE